MTSRRADLVGRDTASVWHPFTQHSRWVDDDHFAIGADVTFDTAVAGARIIVPPGFVTDFASVPRVPLAFMLVGDRAHVAATIHDFLYTTGIWHKNIADLVFKEAAIATGVAPKWAEIMYQGVRFGGEAAWEGHGNPG
jgi:hypothetical protein